MDDADQPRTRAVAEELKRQLVSEISTGRLKPGSRLGSERELAERYEVSRSTLRQVLATLEEAGIVTRRKGRGGGTFVRHGKVDRDMSSVQGVPAYLASQGYNAGTRVVATGLAQADPVTAEALCVEPEATVLEVKRLRLADGKPMSYERAALPEARFPGLLEHPLGGSLYQLLEESYGVRPGSAHEVVEVVEATATEAHLLGVEEGGPLIMITRTTVDEVGAAFEFSKDLFRADRTRLTVTAPGRGIRQHARQQHGYVELRLVDGQA